MKTHIFLISLSLISLSAFGADDAKAVQLLQKAAELHGLASPKALASYELEVVYSGLSGGFRGPSRWLSRVDFEKGLDLGVRYVYDEYERGVAYQRRIEGAKGKFMYGIGAPAKIDLGPYYGGNAVEAVSNVAVLAVRGELQNLKALGPVDIGGQSYEQVSFAYKGGNGTVFFQKDGRYAGRVEINLKDNETYYQVATAYQTLNGILVPSRFTVYDSQKKPGGYGKLLTFRANPAFKIEDFDMNASAYDERGTTTPFGLGLAPADQTEFTGLKVGPQDLEGAALKAGLAEGDEIVAVNGKDVRKADFFALEASFWDTQSLTLSVVRGTKKSEITLAR